MKNIAASKKSPSSLGRNERLTTTIICISLATLVSITLGRALRHEFVNYDDDRYVYKNPRTASGLTPTNIQWAFTHSQVANWHPVTMISHMLDCQLYGLQPWGHHLTNILLHATAAILLFLALRELTSGVAVAALYERRDQTRPAVIDRLYNVWACAFVAAVFAIHPLRVESVAWISERKDVLSGVFFMLTLLAYTRYARSDRQLGRDAALRRPVGAARRPYLATVVFFSLGLMCKPTLVTLPFLLLLLDYWPLQRWPGARSKEQGARQSGKGKERRAAVSSQWSVVGSLLSEKLPLFALSAAFCVITIFVQAGSFAMMEAVTFHQRFTNAIVAYVQYLGQTIYPAHLAVLYPYSKDPLEAADILLALIFLSIVSIGFFLWRKRFPFLLVGWLWFLGMLVPMIGLVQVGSQARADRYTYLPAIGLYILAAWGALALSTKWGYRREVLAAAAAGIVAALATRSYFENSFWQNSETLWRHTIATTSNNYIAHNNLANVLLHEGRVDEAIAEAMNALAAGPNLAEAEGTLGNSYVQKGDIMNATVHYQRALELKPEFAEVQSNLGSILLDQGNVDQAILHYEKALAAQPDYAGLHNNLGNAFLGKGDADAAINQYQRALAIDPNLPDAHNNFGNALLQKAQVDAAIAQYQEAVTLKPDYPEAQYNLGRAFAAKVNYGEAIVHFTEALRLKPDYAEAKDRLRELGALPSP